MSPNFVLTIAILLFFCGIAGALSRRSVLVTSLSLLLSQSGSVLIFVHTGLSHGDGGGMARAMIFILLCGGIAMVQGSVAIAVYRHRASTNLDEFRELRG